MSEDRSAGKEHLRPHVDSTVCGKCRRTVAPGHRVTIAYIAQNVGIDPGTLQKGTTMGAEYEIAHIDCRDPFLVKGLQ